MSDKRDVLHGQAAIAQVEQNLGRPLSYAERRVVEEEGYVATPYLDTKGVTTQGVGQTGEWIEKGFEAAFQHHVDRAKNRISNFDQLPKELQAELIQAEYRGDLGTSPKFVGLVNEGKFGEASKEFLDNGDYRRSLESGSGVHKRMQRVSDAFSSYAGTRPDGTQKSSEGWLGEVVREDGGVMTEYSIGVNIDGKETLVPTLVPTLTEKEVETLRTLPEGAPVPEGIQRKAADHAKSQLDKGESPFYEEKRRVVPEATLPPVTDFTVGTSGYSFVDGDTIKDDKSGERVRLRDIDLAELTTITREGGYSTGEGAGQVTKEYVAYLANKYGYTQVKVGDDEDKYGRKVGDLVDENGRSFTDFLIGQGIAKPTFIGDSTQTMSDESYSRYVWGRSLRSLKDPNKEGKTDVDIARELINKAALDPTNGVPLAKQKAFNEEEFAQFPELFSGVVLRNKDANWDNTSKTPFADSWDAGMTSAANAFRMAGAAMADTIGADDAQGWFEGGVTYHKAKLADSPKVRLSYKDVDWTNFGHVTEFIGANMMMSLPFMGVTMASVMAAPFTYGGSLAVPVGMYSGMVLDEMEGKLEDKSYGIALAGGTLAAALDRLGLSAALGKFTPKHFLSGDAKEAAIEAIMQGGRVATREQAEAVLANATKRELLGYMDDVRGFVDSQITKGYMLKQFANRMAMAGGVEGGTEMMQELTQYTAAVLGSEKTWDYDELQERLANAAIAGGTLGASFSVPASAWQAGTWRDANVAKSEYDKRFEDASAGFRAEEKAKNGFVPDIQTKLRAYWERRKATQERRREDPEFREREESTLDTLAGPAEERRDERPMNRKIMDALKDPGALLRTALDTRIKLKHLNMSPTLRLIYDSLGGKSNRTFGGVDFHNDKLLNYTHFEGFIRPIEEIINSFKVKAKRYGKRRTEISNLTQRFFKEHIRPITQASGNNRKWKTTDEILNAIDWDKVTDQDFLDNRQALTDLIAELYTVDDVMYAEITTAQMNAGEKRIGELQDHIFRSKGFLKNKIAKKKEEFIQLLSDTYGLSRDVATDVTNNIIDNPEINTLDEAFDLTKGGLQPKGHKRRSLNLADNDEFSEFLEQDIFTNLDYLMKGSARYITNTKFVGRNGEIILEQLRDVYKELRGDNPQGSEAEQEALRVTQDLALGIKDLLNADSGNYKRINNPVLRGAQKFATVTATLTMLPLAAISSTVELALVTKGTTMQNIHLNAGSFGMLVGKELYEYFREIGRLSGAIPTMSTFDWQLNSKRMQERREAINKGEDPRYVNLNNPRANIKATGFLSQKTGAAAVTGVTESNQFTQSLMDSFFKVIFLQGITNVTRTMRAAMWNDFLIDNLDIIHRNAGRPLTNEAVEAEKMLLNMGIPIDKMLALSAELKLNYDAGLDSPPELLQQWKIEFDNGLVNFVNAAVPMPGAMSRPLFYSNPHLAMFTQFQGFISQFTATHIPDMYKTIKAGTPGMKFSVFSAMITMLMLGYASQHLKDLIKFGETSPYLSDKEKYLRALYSTGLLGTTERVWSNNYVFPLYENRSRNTGEAVWNLVAGEAPASGLLENFVGFGRGIVEGDSRAIIKRGASMTPFFSPLKHRLYDTSVENGWITGE